VGGWNEEAIKKLGEDLDSAKGDDE